MNLTFSQYLKEQGPDEIDSTERRRFLKLGFKVTGVVLGGSILSLIPVRESKSLLHEIGAVVGTFPYKPHYAMAIYLDRCIDCEQCINACKETNDVPSYGYRATILHRNSAIESSRKRRDFIPVLCNQCNHPPCVRVCPTKATYKDKKTGIVMMDHKLCIGCKTCMTACPYNARYYNNELKAIDKCDFCFRSRLNTGKTIPACVEACPANVFSFGDLTDQNSEVYQLLHSPNETLWALRPELGTMPNVFYLKEKTPVAG